ncbi:Subtilisin-like protease, fibronectin type-III domain [Dillenia turbinata]|uniref:Subtilisin-like protease, fibronectin type-III domain n=1 Tax=Dillenia turbinata TaxID=194707 RepID=A0AAN8W696_9MAGN
MLDVFSEKAARESRIHSFGRSFNGIKVDLAESNRVISVFPNTRHKLHTTRSWDFLGVPTTVKHGRISAAESDIIIGLLDTEHITEFGTNLPVLMTKDLGHHLPNGKANVLLKGILPDATTPWILTVAASSIDRQFRTPTELGNGMKAFGNSINTYMPKNQMYPLISGEKASNVTDNIYGNASACDYGTLSMNKVKGKIVFCLGNSGQDYTIDELGGIGTIVTSDEQTDIALVVSSSTGKKIGEYINSTKEPQAVIYSTTTAPMDAPFVASFSSRATPVKKQPPDAELGSGAGQINPAKAVDPGLVYDLSMSSYIIFLCKEGYNTTTLQLLIGGKKHFNCSNFKPAQGVDGLNYPAFHLQLKCPDSAISAEFHRTVTHVGQGKSVYNAKVTSSKNLTVTVFPSTLTFDKPRQTRSFKVVLKGPPMAENNNILSASLEWSDSKHSVKSPIVVYKPVGLY